MTVMEVRRRAVGLEGVTPLILCGGAGSRLWPLSRADLPRQFLPILSERSLFQQTLTRIAAAEPLDKPIVITGEAFRFIVEEQAKEVGVAVEIVLEPEARGSALAVAAGAEIARRRRPGALTLAIAADHSVLPYDALLEESLGATVAEHDYIVAFGLEPTAAETRFCYIKPGDEIGQSIRKIEGFIDPMDLKAAGSCVRDGCLWNSGALLFRAEAMMDALEAHAPSVAEAARQAVDGGAGDLGFFRLDPRAYATAPDLSIDDAVVEKSDRVCVAPVVCSRSDIASWDAVWRAGAQDADGNVVVGDAVLMETRDSIVHAADGVLATVLGADNLVVVAVGDAVLVADRARAQEVRAMVAELKARGRREVREHRRVLRPWGDYASIGTGERYQVKKITVKPGRQLSLQRHYHRSEHWIVVKGVGEVTRDDEVITVRENESIYLPQCCVHRLANPGKIDLELIEVQVGAYLGEDDIIRIEDDYDRETPA